MDTVVKPDGKHPYRTGTIVAILSALFLTGWFFYWEARNQGFGSVGEIAGKLPFPTDMKNDTRALGYLADAVLRSDGHERTYLVLFQNNLELRPGGGFIGSFGIVRVKDGHVTEFSTHDTGNFDGRIPDTVTPPYPLSETLRIDSWKLRDSNWEPDFPTDASKAEEFYRMGDGQESFDGVIGITADVLSSFLTVTGPVEVPGFPGTYGAETAVIDLERQVEQSYIDQGIDFGERKSVLGLLGRQVIDRVKTLPPQDLLKLFRVLLGDLHRKDIQLVFSDPDLQASVASAGWDGAFDAKWGDDFLMAVDANLNAWKTDSVMKRSMHYDVDLSGETAKARLTIHYENTGTEKTFMVKDYQTFLRVYVPSGSFVRRMDGVATEPVYGTFMGKKYVGALVQVKLGESKDVVLEYDLPKDTERDFYDLKVVRQAGTGDTPVSISILGKDGNRTEINIVLDRDFVLSKSENR
ncbi:MAG: DUF4012 domain-containing protein [Candidatus Moranbacteria bacterium]|nr:DUF4012 domain-containing protein [Candidatus Moranbacteria bacterium]